MTKSTAGVTAPIGNDRNGRIMGDDMLARVCELAFDVAKEGGAPSAMKNYLYLAQRPPRAYSVAQRALEEDETFRRRVAERATVDNAGEAGVLWLQRPAGWQDRFAALQGGAPETGSSIPSVPSGGVPVDERPPMPEPPVDTSVAPITAAATEPAPTVNSIETELSSLRSLVDRLADERQNVRSSVSELEEELQTRRAENLEMSTRLSALRSELTSVQTSEADVLAQRDSALERVAQLEAEVEVLRADVERLSAEAEGSAAEHEAALTSLAQVGSERDSLKTEMASLGSERDAAKAETTEIALERDGLKAELADARATIDALRGELETERSDRAAELAARDDERAGLAREVETLQEATGGLAAERDALASELRSANEEKTQMAASVAAAESTAAEAADRLTALDALQADNEELARRLAVAEKARVDLEEQLAEVSEKWQSSTRQLTVFENVNRQLDAAVAERNLVEAQLGRANQALAGLRDRIGSSHDRIRGELDDIESTFGDVRPATTGAPDDQTEAPIAEIAQVADVAAEFETTDIAAELPEVDTPEVDTVVPEFETPDIAAELSDVGVADVDALAADVEDIEAPDAEVAEIVDDVVSQPTDVVDDVVDAAVVDDAVADDATIEPSVLDDTLAEDFTDIESAPFADDADFDGAGIELDRDLLGGQTIGDMFGTEPEPAPVVDPTTPIESLTDTEMFEPVLDEPAFDESAADELVADLPDTEPEPAVETARARISVDADLDDAAAARQIVHTPDVIMLIDGDGAATLGWPHLEIAARRSALVQYLDSLTAESGAAADVVFERPAGGEDALPVSRHVRVRIADGSIAETPIFASIIDRYPLEWPIAAVTDHESVADDADELGVTVLSNSQLLDLFLDLNSGS